jgi:hypothetical protein
MASGSDRFQVFRRHLAASGVALLVVGDLLARGEGAEAGALDGVS